ncbi:MAG: N-6 DNA methylase, partial [Isosphaeraceae bacterium]
MRTRVRNPFTTVQTSGLLLPVDLLARIVDGDASLPGLTPDSYHLNAGERLNEAAARAWNTCVGNWKAFREASRKAPASDQGTTLTRDKWLLPLFRELGYGWLQANKRSLEIDGKPYPVSHQWQSHVPLHFVSFRFDIDRRTPGATGAAQRSPYSLVQEFLNRSAQHRWGFVSNGLRLVVLHDNVSLVRASNVEFDLEAMFEGEVYPDFVLLFALCHQSRVEILAEERPEECWLEKWSKLAEEQGTRAREKLRVGVERAIQALGTGFRVARGNTALNDALRTGTLDTQAFYRELLRMVYRILLLLVAEDKRLGEDQNLLHPPVSTPEARRRYAQYYSLGRLRKLASQRRGTAHSDLYELLKVLFEKLRSGYAPLAIPGLGSFLFSPETTLHLDSASLANEHLLEAIRHLCYTEDVSGRGGSVLRPVDFGNMGSEELGSVYESLLELHPRIGADEGPFTLAVAAGHERKTTGSYYTPTSLISCLLDSALEPVVHEALSKPDPEKALLSLRICDTACGSGHFLIAAVGRLAKQLASIRTGDDEPSLTAIQHAKRDIIGRCIFGVDLNPMAVELCKVSLWMEALEPGKPLSFLDHHVQVGNSLLGATPALLRRGIPDEAFEPIEGDDKAVCRDYRKQNRDERNRQTTMFDLFARSETIRLSNIGPAMARIESMIDDSIEAIHAKDEAYRELKKSRPYEFAKLLADAWCAAFVIPKVRVPDLQPRVTLTESTLRMLENNPNVVPSEVKDEISRLADRYQFFHWHLAFLNVFHSLPSEEIGDDDILGWKGGFDVVLSNPPWETFEFKEREWFAQVRPDIANAANAAARGAAVRRLAEESPRLYATLCDERRKADGESHLIRRSGKFPFTAVGKINSYAIFAELDRHLIPGTGRVGMVLPPGIVYDDTTKHFFHDLMEQRSLVDFYHFENEEFVFPAVDHRVVFSLMTLTGRERPCSSTDFVFFCRRVEHLNEPDRHFRLTAEEIRLMNPNTGTCPIFRSKRDAEINKAIYRRVPVLIRDVSPEQNPWDILFRQGLFNMATDSGLFRTRDQLEADGWRLDRNTFRRGERTYL